MRITQQYEIRSDIELKQLYKEVHTVIQMSINCKSRNYVYHRCLFIQITQLHNVLQPHAESLFY